MLLKNTTILVATPNDVTRALFGRILDEEGFDVVLAEDGPSALAAVPRDAPDIVLLDALDGLEVCRRLKADASTRRIPVILITGTSELEDRIEGVEAGADDFLSTPLQLPVERFTRLPAAAAANLRGARRTPR